MQFGSGTSDTKFSGPPKVKNQSKVKNRLRVKNRSRVMPKKKKRKGSRSAVNAFDASQLGNWEQDVASLAGMLVHEVKNPLSTLNISSQLLLEELGDPESPRDHRTQRRLETMRSEIQRIEKIVSSFLQLTRPQQMQRDSVDASRLVEDVISRNREAIELEGVNVFFQPMDVPRVAGDASLLHQAVLNLILNGCSAMSEGGEIFLRVLESTYRGSSAVVIEVTDTGVGISEEAIPRIFRPYVSTTEGGTGLGLPTTLRIIRLHGGTILVESEPGQGSRFSIVLPAEGSTQ
ncbi:MAG: two-component sensor histidine kinase [Planctomycetes bacterium]|nr:two-component sensor histidine kinase [Planctomycetota bacterium]